MKATKTSLAALAACLMMLSAGTAVAQLNPRNAVVRTQRAGPTPKVVSKSRPGVEPHAASSFAPHPTSRTVFGAPIQPPIVHNITPPK